ncbi:MAG: HD domain-containing protein [Bacilli bacterium]|nr:HD domain-containing protein [Bacilli bacterium]
MNKVLVLLHNETNRKLLVDLIGYEYDLVYSLEVLPEKNDVDIIIVDAVTLKQHLLDIVAIKEAEKPLVLPIILLTTHSMVRFDTQEIWRYVDDLIAVPVRKSELSVRMLRLLMMRNMSVQLKRKDEALLLDQQARLKLAIKAANIGFWDIDFDSGNVWLSPEYQKFLNYGSGEHLTLSDWLNTIHPEDRYTFDQLISRSSSSELVERKLEFRIRNGQGEYQLYLHYMMIWYSNLKPTRVLGSLFDVHAQNAMEQNILAETFHDHLTGAFDSSFLGRELDRKSESIDDSLDAVIVGDMNGLMVINASLGIAYGDYIIKQAMELLRLVVEKTGMIFRGGGQFTIICRAISSEAAEALYATIVKHFDKAHEENNLFSFVFGYAMQTPGEPLHNTFATAEKRMLVHKSYDISQIRTRDIEIIMKLLFEKSERESLHSKRVSKLATFVGEAMNFDEQKLSQLRTASLLHDIGKILVEAKILNKATRLDQEEWREIVKHPYLGWKILSSIPEYKEIAKIILCHHERWDGNGYPNQIGQDNIPLESRIISVADAYDAMTNVRSYRDPVPHNDAIEEIQKNSGSQFDPEVVACFCRLLGKRRTENELE